MEFFTAWKKPYPVPPFRGGRYGFIVWLNKFLLMLRTEEVVHCLHGIECFEWNLDEDGVPIAHGAVPKAGEFKGQEFATVVRLFADETGRTVDISWKIELLSFVVAQTANQVDGVEMGTAFEHYSVVGIVLVDLRTFQNLQTNRVVGVIGQEGTATGLAAVFHHSANAYRAI